MGKWAEVERRLEEWARYMAARRDGGLGYPSITLTGRLYKQGAGALIRGSGHREPETNEAAEQTEAAIVRMPDRWRELVVVLWLSGSRPTDTTAAKRLACSVAHYRATREQVYAYIAGRLHIDVGDKAFDKVASES